MPLSSSLLIRTSTVSFSIRRHRYMDRQTTIPVGVAENCRDVHVIQNHMKQAYDYDEVLNVYILGACLMSLISIMTRSLSHCTRTLSFNINAGHYYDAKQLLN